MAWIINNLHRHLLSDILFGSSTPSGLPLKQFNSISIKVPIQQNPSRAVESVLDPAAVPCLRTLVQ